MTAFITRRRAGLLLGGAAILGGLACASAPSATPNTGATGTAPASARTVEPIPPTPPALGPVKPLTVPPVTERRLSNGLRVLLVEHHELPVVDLILAVRSGAESDPADRTGLATLAAAMLDEGAGDRDALGIADQAAYLGVRMGTRSGFDASIVSMHAPVARLDSALALFTDVALRPSFPEKELERLRQERLTQLVQLRDRGPAIADRVFPAVVYGGDHPYGRPTTGTQATTTAITRADLQRFYERHYRPNNAVLIVVGDVRPDELMPRLERLMGGWAPSEVTVAAATSAPVAGATRVYLVDRPGSAQSSVRIGAVGVARSTEDYFPLAVMNTILGGSFTSRLNQNLRETHGYTYGAGSSFDMRRAPGPFVARAEIVSAKTDSALLEFMRELRAIRDTVPVAELEKAKQYLQLQLPGDFETTGDIASQLLAVALHDLPIDYFDSYSSRIAAVTQADVRRVAERYVDPSRMAVVVVGDRQSIEPSIRAAMLGETVVQPMPPQ